MERNNILYSGTITCGTVALSRVRHNIPSAYRLRRNKAGETFLQGGYVWTEGFTNTGIEWQDIPTIEGEE